MDVLAEVVSDMSLFLENSDEDVVNPDAAVNQLELIAYRLGALSSDEKQSLTQAFARVAAGIENNEAMRAQILGMPEAFGFLDEE